MTQHKRLFGFVIPLAVILAIIASFTPAFGAEFTADMVITGPGDNYTYNLQIKDNMYRLQKVKGPMNVPPFPSIVNRDTGVTWGLNDQMHQYVEMKHIEKTIMMNPLVGWVLTRKGLTEKPGPTETVNGYECETRIYTETGKSEPVAKVWISKKLNHIIRDERFGLNKNPVLELQNIQEGTVDAALFKIPAGYTKMDMGAGPGSEPVRSPAKAESTQVRNAKTTPTPAPVPVPASSLAQAPGQSISAAASSGNIMFILDASGSMWGQVEGKAKIAIAKEVLTGLIRDLPDDAVVGLVAYGHRRKGDCNDVEELVSLAPIQKEKIVQTIQGLNPKGKTPISRSVRMTAECIKHLEDETTIILVSDGKETCDPDPCGLVKELKEAGIKFVMHVIGFDVTEEEKAQLECMAQAGGGEYFTAKNAKDFQLAAKAVVKKASEKPPVSLQVTSIKDEKPFKTYVQVLTQGGEKRVAKGWTSAEKPATFRLPPGMYDIRAQDTNVIERPTVDIKDVEITEGQMTERIANFATEGVLQVKAIKNNAPISARVYVYRQEDEKNMGGGWTKKDGKPLEYKLLPGVYKIYLQDQSVAQRPEVWIENVEVKADQTVERFATFVAGGILHIKAIKSNAPISARVYVYRQEDEKNMGGGWTKKDGKPLEYKLLPGTYYVKVEDRTDRSVREIRDIQVQSGKTFTVNAAFPVEEEAPAPAQKPTPAPQTGPEATPPLKTSGGGGTPSGSSEQTVGGDTIMNGEVPLMEGVKVLKTKTYGTNGSVEMEVPATPEEIVNYYKQAMTAKGWQLGLVMVQGNVGVLQLKSGGRQMVFRVEGQGQTSKVSMALMGQ